MSNKVLTFTTDFGSSDAYVAAMKGVALGIAPDLTLVDVTHEVPRHDIRHGAFILGGVYRYFPAETVHVADRRSRGRNEQEGGRASHALQ